MSVVAADIATAVVDALKDADFGVPVEVERAYVPVYDLEQFDDRVVSLTVVPTLLGFGARDLAPRSEFRWTVGVWVQRRSDASLESFDPLVGLAESIARLFNAPAWRSAPVHRVIGIEVRPPYDPEMQYTAGLFSAVVFLAFRTSE